MSHDEDAETVIPGKIIIVNGKKIKAAMPIVTTFVKGLMDAGLSAWEVLHLVNCLHIELQEVGQDNGEQEEVISKFLRWSCDHWSAQRAKANMMRGKVN